MSLNFPSYADVPLGNSPLVEVICQVRYPPILRLLNEPPSSIQEAIADRFPQVEIATSDEEGRTDYRFVTKEGRSAASVNSDQFALATNQYSVWQDFAQDLDLLQRVVQQVYQIPFYYRIGLRYVNFFTPVNTGCSSLAEISRVLRSELTTLLRSEAWTDPSELLTQLLLKDSERNLMVRVGAKAAPEEGGPVVFLDFDCYETGQVPVDGLIDRCETFHNLIYDAFRWSLSPGKLSLFKPTEKGVRT